MSFAPDSKQLHALPPAAKPAHLSRRRFLWTVTGASAGAAAVGMSLWAHLRPGKEKTSVNRPALPATAPAPAVSSTKGNSMKHAYINVADQVDMILKECGTNTYNTCVVGPVGDALLIDCGCDAFAPGLIAALEAHGHKPGGIRAIVITHGHNDHFGGAGALQAWSGAEVWAHAAAASEIEDAWGHFISRELVGMAPDTTTAYPDLDDSAVVMGDLPPDPATGGGAPGQLAAWLPWNRFRRRQGRPVRIARMLREGDHINVGKVDLQVFHTPGHERGELSFFDKRQRILFPGDVLQGALSDWLGNYPDPASQRRSLQRLGQLDPAIVCRGHRTPAYGAATKAEIAANLERLDNIENAILQVLAEEKFPQSLGALVMSASGRIFGHPVNVVHNFAAITVHGFLMHLARRNKVHQTQELLWAAGGRTNG